MEKNQPKFEKEIDKYYNLELEMRNFASIEEVEQAECQCCGLKEECTIVYITQVQECYCGKWVCGLCSEAVKERVRGSSPKVSMHDALSSHRDFCHKYNCTRLNPKLFLTISMREIVKRSLENKKSKGVSSSKFGRSTSYP
ncbi:hypothetical protein Lalb_Chr08g0242991 [Lupinus albus]|uniref:Uncharacterized protein n=1 Tax=Lupinus albus TaxID=3870 RepID=A0A6A4Q5X7_LUPAL|nr:hypothetical protein Lalb_Chr08g0242991 [Lupinus albus]